MSDLDEWDEEHDPSWSSPGLLIGPNGLRIMAGPCSTCIFRPGNLMHLNEGRVKSMVADVVRGDSFTQCHKTLGCEPGRGALCHGMTKRHEGDLVRTFRRLGAIEEVDPATIEEPR